MTRDKIVQEKYSAVFNSAVSDKKRRIAELKTPQKLPAIRYGIVYHNTTGVGRGDEGRGHQCFTNTSCYLCVSGDITAVHRVP